MATAAKSSKRRTTKSVRPFWWFQGASVQQLYEQLEQYGPDSARLEVHLDEKNDKMTFRVKSATKEELPPINDSHRCPPDCG